MWNRIKNTFYTATSFLQTGVAPPNAPIRYKEDLSKINFFSSKKFFIVFSSIVLLMFFYLTSCKTNFRQAFFKGQKTNKPTNTDEKHDDDNDDNDNDDDMLKRAFTSHSFGCGTHQSEYYVKHVMI